MTEMFERIDLAALGSAQLAPLENLFSDDWPDTWRDLATSHFLTLVSAPGAQAVSVNALAHLAVALTMGIAQDLGGTQPYIPVGSMLATNAKARRAIELLGERMSYRDVATATGLTESRIRQIEAEWRRRQIALRQGNLSFD